MVRLLLMPLALLLSQCNGAQNAHQSQSEQEQTMPAQNQVHMAQDEQQPAPVEQGITGKVLWVAGNQMPSPDAPPSKGRGVQRTMYVYELTNSSQTTSTDGVFHANIQAKLVAQFTTDANGSFSVSLEPGKYSLFSKEEKGFYANQYDGENNVFPIEVQQGQVTNVEFQINYQANY
ncbi:carboxypeptidase-like regulatory domain-containing protein [Pontibacter oryzae]|uniref:Carboxypeptidase regulatory-like domain-containing protein n=1 Tax=Pontibacter oryzae TaxID=2304593 RepID=A0A399S4F3_9BACT|nr:carboxypeptidase-like regulatory domain-containing protein [Pontibacter oryzae]RIJ37449.1 carboxypeptidase regulatory-like domain-containing protein [Pontibacter oryzae]